MEVWTSLESYKPDATRPLVLALGNFDGLHLGHQKILQNVIAGAGREKGRPAVLTFYDHPQRVLHKSQDLRLLTSPEHRLLLFKEMGVEVCFLLRFTMELSKIDPEQFVQRYLVNQLGVREVHLGYNAHYGNGRSGDCELMRALSKKFGFEFHETEPVTRGTEFVSSSLIRKKIFRGDLQSAEALLGRSFSIFGTVIRGKGRGRVLGFPTANLRPHSEILPPAGVYPVQLRQNIFHLKRTGGGNQFMHESSEKSPWQEGILNYGVRPTFAGTHRDLIPEVFLFSFEGNLYGKTLEVVFHPRMREERAFNSSQELVSTVRKDIEAAQDYFRKKREG